MHTFDSDFSTTNRIVNSFKGIGEDRSKPIVKYESSVSGGSDYDEDDYIDLINFDVPLFDDKNGHLDGGKKNSHHKGNTDKLKIMIHRVKKLTIKTIPKQSTKVERIKRTRRL